MEIMKERKDAVIPTKLQYGLIKERKYNELSLII